MTLITTNREAVDMIYNLLTAHTELGLKYIGKNDEQRLPQYPSAVISAGNRSKELHATHTFAVTLRVLIWLYHAHLDVGHRVRSEEEMQMVEALENVLEADCTFSNQIIFGYVEDETPGLVQPRTGKGRPVIGTRISWMGATQKHFS